MSVPHLCRAAVLLLLAAAFGATASGAPAPLPKREGVLRADHTRLQGVWMQKSIVFEGCDLTEANAAHRIQWVIKEDTITLYTKGKVNNGGYKYRLDASQNPAKLDLTVQSGETYLCIYKLEGDRLTVLLQNFPAKHGRPRDFEARKEAGVGWHVLERVKSGEIE